MKIIFYIIIRFLPILSIFLFLLPGKLYSFNEDFSGKFENSSWNVENSQGIRFTKESVILEGENSSSFPFISAENIFLDQKEYEIKFRYLSAGSAYGDGIAFTDNLPSFGQYLSFPSSFIENSIFYIWHDRYPSTFNLHLASSICDHLEPECSSNIRFFYTSLYPDFDWHIARIVYQDDKYFFYLDNNLLFSSSPVDRIIDSIWIGHPSILGANNWSSVEVDYVLSRDGSLEGENYLHYYSQKDPAWAEEEYDHANAWAGSGKTGIDRWGCALTSAAMVLKANNIGNPSNNCEMTNPNNLNNWLNSQPDGYVGNGLVNWFALERYARDSYDSSCAYNKLEHTTSSYDPLYTSDGISTEQPAILQRPGHLMVTYGEQDSQTWQIADPADESITTLAKSSNLSRIHSFTPAHSDLSGIVAAAPEMLQLSLATLQNTLSVSSNLDDTIDDQVDGTAVMPASNTLWLDTPESGIYILKITNTGIAGTYQLDLHLYDKKGRRISLQEPFAMDVGEVKYLYLDYDNNAIAKTKILEAGSSLSALVWDLYRRGEIHAYALVITLEKYDFLLDIVSQHPNAHDVLSSSIARFIARQRPNIISETGVSELTGYLLN